MAGAARCGAGARARLTATIVVSCSLWLHETTLVAAAAVRARPQCKPFTYAGVSSDDGAASTRGAAPAATSRTASTSRSASDSSL